MYAVIAQLVLQILISGPQAIREFIAIGEQSKALTPEQAAELRRQMEETFATDRWQTDAMRGAPRQTVRHTETVNVPPPGGPDQSQAQQWEENKRGLGDEQRDRNG